MVGSSGQTAILSSVLAAAGLIGRWSVSVGRGIHPGSENQDLPPAIGLSSVAAVM